MALIELDLYAPAEFTVGSPPPGRHRPLGAALVLLLVLALAGATPARSVLWRHAGLAAIDSPQGTYQLLGGQLYTFDALAGRLVTTAWSMDPLRRLWSRSTQVQVPDQDGMLPGLGRFVTQAGSGDVLLQAEQGSTIIDARTGAVRWSSPVPVAPVVGGRIGLIHDQQFRPGTRYDQATGASGPLFFSTTGVFYTEPPVRTTLRALDIRTGRPLWSVTLPGPVLAAPAPGDPDAVLLVAADRLGLRAAATGAVLRERSLAGTAVRTPSSSDITSGLVLLRTGSPGKPGGMVTAYSGRTLAQVWRRPEPAYGSSAYCDGLLCDAWDASAAVLDPATGRPRWRTRLGASLVGRGDGVMELGSAASRPIWLRDTVTGAIRVDLRPWMWYASSPEDDPLVLGRLAGTGMIFGVLLPGRRAVQPLGYSPTPVADCASDTRFVACRVFGGVDVWTYLH